MHVQRRATDLGWIAQDVALPAYSTEQHMQIEGIEPTTNPLFWDYFVAQHTKKMRVGQVGMNLTVVNPMQFAENIAMLDHFTNGRVFAGFSRGNTPRWTATFGQHMRRQGKSLPTGEREEKDDHPRCIRAQE